MTPSCPDTRCKAGTFSVDERYLRRSGFVPVSANGAVVESEEPRRPRVGPATVANDVRERAL